MKQQTETNPVGLNDQPSAQRLHIGFFGVRNAGKSSLVNAVTGQMLSIVSPVAGTTTDPVQKAMELLPLGPVVIIDTPGMDDEGGLGEMRVKSAKKALRKTDLAILVMDGQAGESAFDQALLETIVKRGLPHVLVYNKADLVSKKPAIPEGALWVSAKTGEGIEQLKQRMAEAVKPEGPKQPLVADLVDENDLVILVTPMDASAPKGRLILPQQQTIRDLLDKGAIPLVVKPEQLAAALSALAAKPRLVITDSQAFGKVSALLPPGLPLTSFSILFARFKGSLAASVTGAAQLDRLQDGDLVLISEGCTHHRQCGDIGTVKLPALIKRHTGKDIRFAFTAGGDFPEDLSPYALIIHCGGCMLNEKEMAWRVMTAKEAGKPITNYGIALAHMNGILKRSLAPFPDFLSMLND